MSDRRKAAIICGDTNIITQLESALLSIADTQVFADVKTSYSKVKEAAPELLFLDIRQDREAAFVFAERVARSLPGTMTFILNGSNNPETLLRSLQARAADYIKLPLDPPKLSDAITAVLKKNTQRRNQGQVFVLGSNRGGQGVTTLSVNLAAGIRDLTQARVLLVDLKLQTGDVSLFLDIDNAYSVTDLLRDIPRLDENLLLSSIVRTPSGFFVVTAPDKLDKTIQVNSETITQMFQVLKEHMDYIIVDMAREVSDLTAPVMDLADRIMLVTQQTVPALRSVREILDLFGTVGFEKEKIGIIINRHEKGNDIGIEQVEKLFEQTVFATVANDYKTVTDAINQGRLLARDHARSPVHTDILSMARQLCDVEKSGESRHSGIFSNLYHKVKRLAKRENRL